MSDAAHKTNPAEPLGPGDWVQIEGLAGIGQVLEVDPRRRRARVRVHEQEWLLALKKLTPTAPPPNLPEAKNLVRVMGAQAVLHEIDLHGMRVEEALALVDRTLDQAVVSRLLQVKIIHGHGTGAVRNAVRQLLARHPHVVQYRFGGPSEGGLACTVAEIRPARP